MNTETIDITSLKETGKALVLAIVEAVKDTQLLGTTPLPDRLIMTQTQFNELNNSSDSVASMHGTEDKREWMYATPMNIMEVTIKG